MSKYTTELRYILESYAGERTSVPYSGIDLVIEKARPKLFDFTYPIFDESYRPALESAIMRNFYLREIGEETAGLFKFRLATKMREIMPKYNLLYQSELMKISPLFTSFSKTTRVGEINETGSTSQTGRKDTSSDRDLTENNDKTLSENTVHKIDTNGTSQNNSSGTSKDVTAKSSSYSDTANRTDSGTEDQNQSGENNTRNTGTENRATTGSNKNAFSATPQGTVNNVENLSYLTDYRAINETGSDNLTLNTQDSTDTSGQQHTTRSGTAKDTGTGTAEDDTTANGETATEERGTTTGVENGTNGKTGTEADTRTAREGITGREDSTEEGTSQNDTTEKWIEQTFGINGQSYTSLIVEFVTNYKTLDQLVCDELECCFLQLW